MVRREDALPGRDRPTPWRRVMPCSTRRSTARSRPRDRLVRHGLLLGRREAVLAGQRRALHLRRLRGRLHPQPDLRGGLLGLTGHAEVVRVVFDPRQTSYAALLKLFWKPRPTQGMRQGNDCGTQYRSAIYWTMPAQQRAAEESRARFQARLAEAGYGVITTEIAGAPAFYFAEDSHQQDPGEEPVRLLRPRRDRRDVPRRPHDGRLRRDGDGRRRPPSGRLLLVVLLLFLGHGHLRRQVAAPHLLLEPPGVAGNSRAIPGSARRGSARRRARCGAVGARHIGQGPRAVDRRRVELRSVAPSPNRRS